MYQKLERAGSFTKAEWAQLLDATGHKCACCGIAESIALYRNPRKKPPVFGRLTRDHKLPVSRGGTDSIDNIQPLCWYCNRRKHNRHIDYLGGKAKSRTG